jgi:hypothetical protein
VARDVPKVNIGEVPSQRGLDLERLPQNIAVYAGATITFTCWVSSESAGSPRIQWTEFAYNPNGQLISDGDFILPAHPQADRYSLVRDDPFQYDLVIADVNLNDGGVYSCFDANAPVTEKQRAAAQLIVIGGLQNCTSTVPNDGNVIENVYYTTECTLDYSGNIVPHANWNGPQPFGQAQSSTDNRVWSGMSFYAHRTMTNQNWRNTFNFTDYFHPVPVDTADNVPDFDESADSTRITVFWAPQNMYADPMKDNYLVGDTIECFADAFPTASFEWHNLRTNERISGSLLTIPQEWEGTTQTLRCQAINTINGAQYSNDLYIPGNVPAPTTIPTTTTPATTTPPPAVADCFNLTGRWESVGPTRAYMCIEVLGENGNIHGVLRNDTDTFWVDLVGVTDIDTYDHASFTGIWPLNRAVSTFIGECSRCYGVEHLLINAVSRTKGGPPCATPGEINYSLQYDFLRNPDIACPPITIPDSISE